MTLLELINKVKDVSINLEIKTSVMKYKYQKKYKIEEKEKQIIVFGIKESLENFDG